VQYFLLVFTIFEILEDPIHGENEFETSIRNQRHNIEPGTLMNHATASFSTKIVVGAGISVVQYLAPLRYAISLLQHVVVLLSKTEGPQQPIHGLTLWTPDEF
jgi:hypothetical protein